MAIEGIEMSFSVPWWGAGQLEASGFLPFDGRDSLRRIAEGRDFLGFPAADNQHLDVEEI